MLQAVARDELLAGACKSYQPQKTLTSKFMAFSVSPILYVGRQKEPGISQAKANAKILISVSLDLTHQGKRKSVRWLGISSLVPDWRINSNEVVKEKGWLTSKSVLYVCNISKATFLSNSVCFYTTKRQALSNMKG